MTSINAFWTRRGPSTFLWILQGLLAALFLFAGVMKLILPIAAMTTQIPLPGWFFRFVAVMEIFGALGLVLPWALRIRRELTPIAACGLIVIMIGATTLTLKTGNVGGAIMPFVVGILLAIVAYGRWSYLATACRTLRSLA